MTEQVMRGDIRLYDFGPSKNHTAAKLRPVVVIQYNIANKYSQTTIIAIIRSNPKVGELPVGVEIEPGDSGLDKTSYVDLGHIYTVETAHLQKKIGVITPMNMEKINNAISISLGLKPVHVK